MLLEPKEITIVDSKGNNKVYVISKFPAFAGREIMSKYNLNGQDYNATEETVLKLMCFVAVPREGGLAPLQLTNKTLVDNHVDSWETLIKLEVAIMEYNCSFFQPGVTSNSLNGFAPISTASSMKI
jgi:hypothetical protein